MTESTQPTRFALEGAITIDTAGRVNTSRAFCDLYTDTHPIAGKVALKMPRDSSYSDATMELIESEAAVWIKLNHQRILKFLGLYTDNEAIYLVSPFAEFGSLPSYLQSFPDVDRGRFVIEIAEGLVYLYQFEPAIVHGDVNGNNVLVASDHHARLYDFGLARHVDARTATVLKVSQSSLDQSINALKITLTDISKAIDSWANYGNAMALLKNDEILAGIRKYRSDLTSLQQKLSQEYWNQRFETAGEADRALLAKVTSDIAALSKKMDEMQQYFANYRPYSREDPDISQLSKVREALFGLRNEKQDEPFLRKLEIEGEVRKIGTRPAHAGSMYDIWKGVWLEDYSVALKVFRGVNPRQNNRNRVNRQIDLWMSLRHPNILKLYGVCTLDKGPNPRTYFVSPWMKHRDAVTYCKAKPSADRLRLIYDVAKGLEYLHSVNIMHGALQGSNVLVTLNGSAVLSDFSLSRVVDGGAVFTRCNGPGGELRWMSPEARNQELITDQSDVYSWGMTALQILSLRVPFYKIKALGQLVVGITLRKVRPERADYQGPDITDPIWALFVECWKPAAERPTVQRLLDVVGSERQRRKGWDPEAESADDE